MIVSAFILINWLYVLIFTTCLSYSIITFDPIDDKFLYRQRISYRSKQVQNKNGKKFIDFGHVCELKVTESVSDLHSPLTYSTRSSQTNCQNQWHKCFCRDRSNPPYLIGKISNLDNLTTQSEKKTLNVQYAVY